MEYNEVLDDGSKVRNGSFLRNNGAGRVFGRRTVRIILDRVVGGSRGDSFGTWQIVAAFDDKARMISGLRTELTNWKYAKSGRAEEDALEELAAALEREFESRMVEAGAMVRDKKTGRLSKFQPSQP